MSASSGTRETQRRVSPASQCRIPPPGCCDFHLGSGDVLITCSSPPQPGAISTAVSWTNPQGFCPCALRFLQASLKFFPFFLSLL